MAIIKVDSLGVNYSITTPKASGLGRENKKVAALSNITFELADGDRLAVIGVSGSGKSTLLKVLSGALPYQSGELQVAGDRLSLLNRNFGLLHDATLYENALLKGLSFGLKKSMAVEFANEAIAIAGLEDKAHHPLNTMSAGMGGRFNLAINTLTVKEITILDEWVGELGMGQLHGDGLLAKLSRQQGIVVMASHNEALVRNFANKVLLIDQGQLLYFGDDIDQAYRELRSIQNDRIKSQRPAANSKPAQRLHFLFPRRCGNNVVKVVADDLRHSQVEIVLHDENDRTRLCDIPLGEKVVLFYRDPVERFCRIFQARKNQGAPFHYSPWTQSEEAVFDTGVSCADIVRKMSASTESERFSAFRAISRVQYLNSGMHEVFGSVEYLQSRANDIVATIDASEILAQLTNLFAQKTSNTLMFSQLTSQMQKHIDQNLADSLDCADRETLERWLSQEYEMLKTLRAFTLQPF